MKNFSQNKNNIFFSYFQVLFALISSLSIFILSKIKHAIQCPHLLVFYLFCLKKNTDVFSFQIYSVHIEYKIYPIHNVTYNLLM